MTEIKLPDTSPRSAEEIAAVSSRLESLGGVWTATPPDYTTFARGRLLQNLDQVTEVIAAEIDPDLTELNDAYAQTERFINGSFDFFEGKRKIGRQIARAFCVPMRSDREDDANASESVPFFRLYDPERFGVSSDIRMRAMYGLPPTVLDTYFKSNDDNETGALVLVPMYADMLKDVWPDKTNAEQAVRMAAIGGEVLSQATHFAHNRLGAKVLGLGAILPHPTITNFGRNLHAIPGMENLVTTTGHGGTVHMIVETAKKILEETSTESHGKLGVIGGSGSIGWSSSIAALDMIKDHKIVSYDARLDDLHKRAAEVDEITVTGSVAQVLRETNVIIAAITGKIDLNDSMYDGLSLEGKVIIDDSQPGCFDLDQVEARGGKLVWVVGEDASSSQFVTRDGYYTDGVPYNYGDSSGLYGKASEFACGQEAAVIAKYAAYSDAVMGPVRPDNVRAIGKLFHQANLRVAPFQAFGKPVQID